MTRATDGVSDQDSDWRRSSLFAVLRFFESTAPDAPRLGEARRVVEDAVRIGQTPHLAYVTSEIAGVEQFLNQPARIGQYVFGLLGPNGPLPTHLTELAFEQARHHDNPALAAFLDLFHHRLVSLFYRAWADSDPVTAARTSYKDPYACYLRALGGFAMGASRERDSIPDDAKLYWGGTLGAAVRSAERLQRLLADYFELPVRIIPFVGAWLAVPEDERCLLSGRSASNRLGLGATLGSRSWQRHSRFEIVLGPLNLETFHRLLPDGDWNQEVHDWVRLYTHDEWGWQTRLVVDAPSIAPVALGHRGRLGWDSWVGCRRQVGDEVVLHPDSRRLR